jgi:hypothetical protein
VRRNNKGGGIYQCSCCQGKHEQVFSSHGGWWGGRRSRKTMGVRKCLVPFVCTKKTGESQFEVVKLSNRVGLEVAYVTCKY